MKNVDFPIGNDNTMCLKNIKMVRESSVNNDFAVFKILSPICLKRHTGVNSRDWYVSIGDKDFAMEIQKKLVEEMPYYEEKIDNLMFNFDDLKKIVVRAYGLKIPVTIGTFVVQGDSRILNHILKNGIGSKRNSGFGLIEVITQKEVI